MLEFLRYTYKTYVVTHHYLEPSHQDASNEGSQHMFQLRNRKKLPLNYSQYPLLSAGSHVAVGSASGSRGPGFDTRSGHILLFLLQLIQEL